MDANECFEVATQIRNKEVYTAKYLKSHIRWLHKKVRKAVRRGDYSFHKRGLPWGFSSTRLSEEEYYEILERYFTKLGFEFDFSPGRWTWGDYCKGYLTICWAKNQDWKDDLEVCVDNGDKLRHLIMTGKLPSIVIKGDK